MESARQRSRQYWLMLCGLLAVATAVRVVGLLCASRLPFFTHHRLDALVYHELGQRLAAGDWSFNGEVFHLSPLYSSLVGVVYALFGDGPWPIRLVQLGFGLGIVALIYDATFRLFGWRTAALAGAVAALYGPLVFFEQQLSVATLAATLNAALVVVLLWAMVPGERRLWRWLAVGALWGLAILARANALVLFVPIAVGVQGLRRPIVDTQRIAHLLAVCLAAAAIVSPVTLRNWRVSGDFIPTTDSGGLNFYIGNAEGAIGTFRVPAELREATNATAQFELFTAYAEEQVGRSLSPREVDRFWWSLTLDGIRLDPGSWLVLMLDKVWLFWNGHEIPNTQNYQFHREINPFFGLPLVQFAWLAPFALLGMLLMFRRSAPHVVIGLSILSLFAGIVLIFVLAHYRLVVVPLLIVAAAGCGRALYAWLRDRQWIRLTLAGAVLAWAAFLTTADLVPSTFDDEYFKLGYAHHIRGEFEPAHAAYQEALRINEGHLSTLKNLAMLYVLEERIREAVQTWVRLGLAASQQRNEHYENIARENLSIFGFELPP